MLALLKKITLLCGVFLFVASVNSCKDPVIEEAGLLTSDDSISLGKIDTLTALLSSVKETKPVSSGVATGLVGNMNDPYFGKTYAGLYAQVRMLTNNLSFGSNPVADSMVLTLKFRNTYGPYTVPQNLFVFRLDQTLDPAIQYTSDYTARVQYPAIGSITGLIPNTEDSVAADGIKYAAHLRIRLSNNLAAEFLNADSTNFADNTAFLNFFKGFYIASSSDISGDGLVSFDLYSVLSGISLYYHNDAADSLKIQFVINSSSATINKFDQLSSGSPVERFIQFPAAGGDSIAFIQAGGGSKAKIYFPYLDSIPKNLAVNLAELVITKAYDPSGSDSIYLPPQFLELLRLDEAGQEQVIADANDDGTTTLVALRREETVNGVTYMRYRFRLNRYIQQLARGSYRHLGFSLKAISQKQSLERAIISNGSSPDYKISFNLIYTKL